MNIKKTVALYRVMEAYHGGQRSRGYRLMSKLVRRIARYYAHRNMPMPRDLFALKYDMGLYGCIAGKYGYTL